MLKRRNWKIEARVCASLLCNILKHLCSSFVHEPRQDLRSRPEAWALALVGTPTPAILQYFSARLRVCLSQAECVRLVDGGHVDDGDSCHAPSPSPISNLCSLTTLTWDCPYRIFSLSHATATELSVVTNHLNSSWIFVPSGVWTYQLGSDPWSGVEWSLCGTSIRRCAKTYSRCAGGGLR